MFLETLTISQLRNIETAELSFSNGFNVLHGENGAGKTSVLEAIHFLSQARSFKARNAVQLINHRATELMTVGRLREDVGIWRVGISRSREGVKIRIDGEDVSGPAAVAARLPVVAIHPDSFSLLVGSRAETRAYLDWGVFYTEPSCRDHWRDYARALKQRNAAIRGGKTGALVRCWDRSLAEKGEAIADARERYLQRVEEVLPRVLGQFGKSLSLTVNYSRGWTKELGLLEQLERNYDSDLARGFTQSGPQRGGFSVRVDGHPLGEVASRGQVKLATIAFKLAQLMVFQETVGKRCILLLDDLDAELDRNNFERFLEVIETLGVQTFMTTLHPEKFTERPAAELRLFHVEHGQVRQVV